MMRLGTASRIALATLASASLGGIGAVIASGAMVFELGRSRLPENLPQPKDSVHRVCLEDPDSFELMHGFFETWGYDAVRLASQNPRAPALPQGFPVPQVGRFEPHHRAWTGVRVAIRTAESGPCSLLVLAWRPAAQRRPWFVLGFGALTFFGLAALGGGCAVWVVRPFLRRVRRLRESASRVGSQGYRSARSDRGDDLDAIGEALDQAHCTIQTNAARLEARHVALEEHLQALAHDVRTPLASLSLNLEALEAEGRAGESALRKAVQDVQFLHALAENLAIEARWRDGRPSESVRVDLRDVVRRVTERYVALSRRMGGQVDASIADHPIPAACDPILVEQALGNLVHNALDHGGPRVTVTMVLDEAPGGFELRVVDDGPGVPREVQEAFRADADRMPSENGSGRGLAIARKAVELQGWSMDIRVDPEGTDVAIRSAASMT
jgi:signal transduction histidine kinase